MSRGVCTVPGCERVEDSRGWCHTHLMRWRRHGDPAAGRPIEEKITGGQSYWSVRERLKTERGPATAQACTECGAPAAQWSYLGGDPDERVCPHRGYRYSMELDRYRPKCHRCHRRAAVALAAPSARRQAVLDVDQVVRLYEAGATGNAIAHELGVSRNAVYRALRARHVLIRPQGTRGGLRRHRR